MNRPPGTAPCFGYSDRLHYPDIEPEELAREEAQEQARATWPGYLQRTLTAGPHRPDMRQARAVRRESPRQP